MARGFITALVLGGILALTAPVSSAQAALVLFEFNGTGGDTTVQATLGIDSSLVIPDGTFTHADLSSFSVQYNGTFTAASSSLPPSLSGQFNNVADVFSSLFVNAPLTIPGHTGTNNFQFFGLNGESWSMAVTGPAPGPVQLVGTGTWTVAPIPVPAAIWLFGSGLAGVIGLERRTSKTRSIGS